jgi:predicted transcriptional regulator
MEALEDERKRQNEAAQKQRGEADAELGRLKEKCKDGI